VEAEKDPKAYANQADFLSKEFFRYANLADRGYDNVPDVFTAFESYAKLISELGADVAKPLADAQLAKIPATSRAYRLALGGLASGFKTTQSPLYPPYTQQYLATYRDQSLGEIGRIEYDLKRAGSFTPGMTAPDLMGLSPENKQITLSQFRGNYVMIDFWASWCGPCRRENPNVKALYEKYHDKGFNILGVSLDRERGAWVKAIEADGLTWNHISDLKGWNSEHARIYGVTSIPQTVLLDKDGNIVARNLRGEDLRLKLESIYGQ
jgi:thiol-disulfide isomerase/thioredoxin